jgi:hypothetical protein
MLMTWRDTKRDRSDSSDSFTWGCVCTPTCGTRQFNQNAGNHPKQSKRQKLKDSSASAYIGAAQEGADGDREMEGGAGAVVASEGGKDVSAALCVMNGTSRGPVVLIAFKAVDQAAASAKLVVFLTQHRSSQRSTTGAPCSPCRAV